MKTIETIVEIIGPNIKANVVLWNDQVAKVDPVVGFALGWQRTQLRDYCTKNGWTMVIVSVGERLPL